jgi:hypothetical protein
VRSNTALPERKSAQPKSHTMAPNRLSRLSVRWRTVHRRSTARTPDQRQGCQRCFMFEPTLLEKARHEGLKSPSNTRLAVEIKMLDEDIAEPAARMERSEAGRNASTQRFGTSKKTTTLRCTISSACRRAAIAIRLSLSHQTATSSTVRYLPISNSRIRFDRLSLYFDHLTFAFSSSKALNAMGQTPILSRTPRSLETKCGFSK